MHLVTQVGASCWVVGVFGIACAKAEPSTEVLARRGAPPAVAGCYTLATGHDTVAFARARAFRLELRPASAKHPDLHPATSLVDSTRERLSLWSADSLSDTVRVSIGDGFTGVTAVVMPSRDGLRGHAISYGDMGPSASRLGEIAYERRPCSAEG
jgi:hypothetical protein